MTDYLDEQAEVGTERPGLRGLDLKPGYDSSDKLLETFYVPALSRAVAYDRSVGFFRSSALSVAARGVSRFINGGGTVRLLCGAEITAIDRDALLGRSTLDGAFAERLAERLVTESDVDRRRLGVLAWLAREGRLEVRIAIAVDEQGTPHVGGESQPYFHEKIGVLRDVRGDGVAFQGSNNETATGWARNFESFSAYASWDATATHFSFWANKFDEHWAGRLTGFRVYPLPDAAREGLIRLAPDVIPGERDPEETPPVGDDAVVARYLRVAPRLVGAEAVAQATVGVQLFPHQRQVVERLAGLYPRSWLVADEVGLGKTISAGMALRRLVLSGRVRRALILAPANVCRQWQDELFEKFGLWVPRLDRGRIHGAHPDDVQHVRPGANPYAEHQLLIASSHLARRPGQQRLVMEAAPYDLLIVDEAHHARRSHLRDDRYRPGRLLELLDHVTNQGAAKALWLLTATPMQVAPIELCDLLVHIGLHGALADEDELVRYFREITKDDEEETAWAWLDLALQDTPRMPRTAAESAVLNRVSTRIGPVAAALIERFGSGEQSGEEIAKQLTPSGRAELRAWLRAISPVGQFVTRHSRETLRLYRARGLLSENLAERDVQPRHIPFTPEELELYDELDELLDQLMLAHGSRRGAGFVLTVYRRRLTSSWAAIHRTLEKRLKREQLALDEDLAEEVETAIDWESGDTVDDVEAVPLTDEELSDIQSYIDRIATVADSKFDQLQHDINEARGDGHSTIVFTQFTDTLNALRDKLVGSYRSQLATFTGDGGQVFREAEGWVPIPKRDLVDAIRSRRVTVLLANDAASEGLNLQACSYLINYDMPWNPMRVEQRIGRIDRLGQPRDVVHVRNYFIPNTVEDAVYRALLDRISSFEQLVGGLQPILGATEEAFRRIASAPRHDRPSIQQSVISDLVRRIDTLEREAPPFTPDDPMPVPEHREAPVRQDDLREVFVERFAAIVDEPDRPVTWDPSRASRDAEGWTALATYAHPRLDEYLVRRAGPHVSQNSALVIAGGEHGPGVAVRADRTPPEVIRRLAEIDELGPPTARGDAEELANRLSLEEVDVRRSYETQILSARRGQAIDALSQRFINLVHNTLEAGCAASRWDCQEGADPVTVWYDLLTDHAGPWGYAETLRKHLGVPLAQLIPSRLATSREPITREEWSDTRRSSGDELLRLFYEYRTASVFARHPHR